MAPSISDQIIAAEPAFNAVIAQRDALLAEVAELKAGALSPEAQAALARMLARVAPADPAAPAMPAAPPSA